MAGKELHVGMTVTRYPLIGGGSWSRIEARTGTVTYIHPRKRYHMVSFRAPRGQVLRECFWGAAVEPQKAHTYAKEEVEP